MKLITYILCAMLAIEALVFFFNRSPLFGGTTSVYSNQGGTGSTALSAAFVGDAAATFQNVTYQSFFYSTSTAWTGTTTISLELSYQETWNQVQCRTDVGTLNLDIYMGTPSSANGHMTFFNASTTVGTTTLGTLTPMSTTTRVDIGTPASSPTKINCTFKKTL